MSSPPAPVVCINILNGDFQANTVLSYGSGGRVSQSNSMHRRIPVAESRWNAPPSRSHPSTTTSRRIEAQPRIRQKLEEVSVQPKYASSRIGRLALLATAILSVVEENVSLSTSSVDLAMDAHAVAYTVVVSFVYQKLRMSRKRVDKLNELLETIHALLVKAAVTRNIVSLLKRFATRNRRKVQIIRSREELLKLLRKIEKNNDTDVLSSLNDALDYHHQHSDVDAEE